MPLRRFELLRVWGAKVNLGGLERAPVEAEYGLPTSGIVPSLPDSLLLNPAPTSCVLTRPSQSLRCRAPGEPGNLPWQ
jgi:hypothetical protein